MNLLKSQLASADTPLEGRSEMAKMDAMLDEHEETLAKVESHGKRCHEHLEQYWRCRRMLDDQNRHHRRLDEMLVPVPSEEGEA